MSKRILRDNIYLIGNFSNCLSGSKLPSNREILKVLFFNLRVVKLNLLNSAKLVIEELIIFWEKARILFRDKKHCIDKLEKLYFDWRNLNKSSKKPNKIQNIKESSWTEKSDDIFDIAHTNAFGLTTKEEDNLYGIDIETTQKGVEERLVKNNLSLDAENIKLFVNKMLKTKHARDDYKELLVLIFLGETEILQKNVFFHFPGAVHHARWMAKAIYCLKIYLVRDEFKLSLKEQNALLPIFIFIVEIFVEMWFCAPLAVQAAFNDFNLLSMLIKFKEVDADITHVALNKYLKHLWYVSPECIALAFFDENIPVETKLKMVKGLQRN